MVIIRHLFPCYQPVLSQLFKPHNMSRTALHVITITERHKCIIYTWPTFGSLFPASVCAQAGYFSRRDCGAFDPGHVIRSFCVPEICTWYKQGFASHANVNQIKLSCQCYPLGSSGNLDSCTHRPHSSWGARPELDSPVCFNVPMRPCAN